MTTAHVQKKFRCLCITEGADSLNERGCIHIKMFTEFCDCAIEKRNKIISGRAWQGQAYLKPPPNGAVEKLRMICRGDSRHVARQGVDLQQKI